MSTTTLLMPAEARPLNGGGPGRRAVVRWAWRLFRREWRQQVLIMALIAVAVTATVLGATVATTSPQPADAGFGTAQDQATFPGTDSHLAGEIASLQHRFGRTDVIMNQTLTIPGSVNSFQLRAQDPYGPFGQPMLALLGGHYPAGPGQVALTPGLASAFNVKPGGFWHQGATTWRVVGIAENPLSLLDEFALVTPGQVRAPTLVTVLFDAPGAEPGSIGPDVRTQQSRSNAFNPETFSIAGLVLGMLLITLVAVGGFTVLAQRRLRSLGLLESLGATDRNTGLVVRANGAVAGAVGAAVGSLAGLAAWLAYRPALETSSHHVIGMFALPWPVVILAMVLAVAAAYSAASRPARTITKIPVMDALSGKPAPPKRVHRSALPGIAFLAAAFMLLSFAGAGGNGQENVSPTLVLGLVALIPGVIQLSPFCLAMLAMLGQRAPIAVRLALRDLSRYRARSGSALAAISLGVMIAVIISVVVAARYADVLNYAGPNLAPNQVIVYTPAGVQQEGIAGGGTSSAASAGDLKAMRSSADSIAASLGSHDAAELQTTSATLQHASPGERWYGTIYVATPQLLRAFGITASQIAPAADILSMRPGLSGITKMQLVYGSYFGGQPPPRTRRTFPCPASDCLPNPVTQQISALPSGTQAPNTVITEHAVRELALHTTVSGWLIQSAHPLTARQITNARLTAAAAGLTVTTRNSEPSSSDVGNWASGFGIVLALSILAMSVGLIRSETANDLRTLAATGASTWARRTLAATTAGALGLLGAVLGTVVGYAGVVGWVRSNSLIGGLSALGSAPVTDLIVILAGLPLIAAAVGWLLAGRQPPVIARQPAG
jgi:putative ABC transport system permease protein